MKGLPSYPNPLFGAWSLPEDVPEPNLWYRFCRFGFGMLAIPFWQLRIFNRHYEPTTGSALYLCNHQSYLDPAIMSLSLKRPMNFMAREELFKIPIFSPWIASVKAFPVKRASADTGALKEALRRLRVGGQLVVFPEGTRTRDGSIGPFAPGVSMLAKRAAEWVVPVVIDGAFEAWPRTQPLPSFLSTIVVVYGKPLHRDEVRQMRSDEFLAAVREKMIAIQTDTRKRLGKPPVGTGEAEPQRAQRTQREKK